MDCPSCGKKAPPLRWTVLLIFVLLAIVVVYPLLGQTSHVPYDPFGGPTFATTQVNYSYAGSYTSIRAVDFRNFTFNTGGPGGPFSLKNGSDKHDEPNDHTDIKLASVQYLGSQGQAQSALVLLSWFAAGGSSSQGGSALIFTVSSNRLRLTQTMQWDTHFETTEPTDSFDPRRNKLVVRTAHYMPGDARCCVSAMDVITLLWDGTRFVPANLKTELSDYGRDQGKTLSN